MQLMTDDQRARLIRGSDRPILCLYLPHTEAVWFLSEYDPCTAMFFGLCDTGQGFPEIGFVSENELRQLHVETDHDFVFTKTLTEYADEARENGAIHYE